MFVAVQPEWEAQWKQFRVQQHAEQRYPQLLEAIQNGGRYMSLEAWHALQLKTKTAAMVHPLFNRTFRFPLFAPSKQRQQAPVTTVPHTHHTHTHTRQCFQRGGMRRALPWGSGVVVQCNNRA